MEDPIAREGTLARCNQDRDATADDPECVNARRAASTAAARAEAGRAEQLEAASEIKREALRDRVAIEQAEARRAEEEARQAEEAAYDAQWSVAHDVPTPGAEVAPAPSFEQPPAPGQPVQPSGSAGTVAGEAPSSPGPTRADSLSFIEVPQIESPVRLGIELPAIAKPRQPEPRLEELTIPRPFRQPDPE